MPFMELDTGIRMHFRDAGEGPPILFVPGFAATVDAWNYQVGDLCDRHRCVCVDLRGHGASDKPASAYTYAEMCADLAALLRGLDLREITIVGWSMGAGVALSYLVDHNADGRVVRAALVNPATPRFVRTETEPFGLDEAAAAATLESIRRAYPETMAAFADANFHRTDLAATRDWFLRSWLELPAYAAHRYFSTLLTADLRDRLPEVDVPMLICQGRHDQVCDTGWSEYLAAHVAGSKLEWFEGSGHCLMVEEPDKLSAELAAFAGAGGR
ncbi:MAG: alpha/beta hydrolase [Pseudonocardia sp.]|nr:alpha/beta hydrolase [Pseudonocardia sp.]